jgi:hypothetical protein
MLLDMLLATHYLFLVHVVQDANAQFDIRQQLVTPTLAEVLADHHTQHLEILGVGRHGVSRDDPGAATQLVGESELVVVLACFGVETEGDEGETLAMLLGHDDEAQLGEAVGEVVGCAGQIGHDGAVAALAEADQLVVLADHLGGAFGKVQGERGLICTKVIDVKDKFLREILGRTPNDPPDTWIDKAVSVAV